MSDQNKLKKDQDDQKRLAVLSMEVDFRAGISDMVRFSTADMSFIIKLAHEAIKNRNIQNSEQNR